MNPTRETTNMPAANHPTVTEAEMTPSSMAPHGSGQLWMLRLATASRKLATIVERLDARASTHTM
jgi:hypothetical protein